MKNSETQPTTIDNPEWLQLDPEGIAPRPPVNTRTTDLPFTELDWRDFERLCKRISECGGNVEQVWSYGTPGQNQYGIDILVRMADSTYEVWQTKRYKKMNPATLQSAADLFLQHKWASKAKRFVLAVACNLNTTGAVEKIDEIYDQLAKKEIEFECLDADNLSKRLVAEPEIIGDFFGRPWLERVCPPEALEIIATRLSRFELADLRQSLAKWFGAWTSTVDPGLPIADLGKRGQSTISLPINERYIQPDVMIQAEHRKISDIGQIGLKKTENLGDGSSVQDERSPRNQYMTSTFSTQRVDLNRFLLSAERSIIVGDAGMGKSTLLRIIALDILSDKPQFDVVRDKYSTYLPVWVPFSLWTRMAAERTSPPSLEEVVRAFFLAQSEPQLADAICKALGNSKVLLLVDGLDEASDPVAARTVAATLSSFVESRDLPAIVTTRPHGIQAMSGATNTWTKVELAPLTETQRSKLAMLWFRVIVKLENEKGTDDSWLEKQAERRTNSLDIALKRSSSIAKLSQTPLILLTLMQLHRQGNELPKSKYAALEKIIDQLVEHQPRRREVQSLSTAAVDDIPKRQRDRLLFDFAFSLHTGELRGPFTDAASEENAVDRASKIIMQRQGHHDQDRAEIAARSVFQFAEERAGVLVKKAPQAIGFLHLSIQEFLVSRHISQFSFSDRIQFIRDNAEKAHWREPILCLLYLEQNETQVGELLQAIEGGLASTIIGQKIRDTLLVEAVFSDFAHDVTVVRKIAQRILNVTELEGWGEQRRHILTSTVDGLTSEATGELCYTRLMRWLPDRHGYQVSAAIDEMPSWPKEIHEECCSILIRSLSSDNSHTRQAAAKTLPLLHSTGATKDKLLAFLRVAPTIDTVASILYALGCGWGNDLEVSKIANCASVSQNPNVAMEGIRIRAKRNETNLEDLDRFVNLNFSNQSFWGVKTERELIEYFSKTHRSDFILALEQRLKRDDYHRRVDTTPIIGALILCDNSHPAISPELSKLLDETWSLRKLIGEDDFPTDKILWNEELLEKIHKVFDDGDVKFLDYELYWVSKIFREPWLKKEIIKNLSKDTSFHYWSARALIEHWGHNDIEVQESLLPFLHRNSDDLASVAEFMPLITEDKQALRKIFLRAINDQPQRVSKLVHGLRLIEISSSDEEAFKACLEAGTHIRGGPIYKDQWREQMILTFPNHFDIREMANNEMQSRDGNIGAIAKSYSSEYEMMSSLLNAIQPLPESDRSVLVRALNDAATANDKAIKILESCQNDSNGAIALDSTTGWVKSLVARNAITNENIENLTGALRTVGPDYPSRRLAAVLALASANRLDVFANATDHDKKPLKIEALGGVYGDGNTNLLKVLRIWPQIVASMKEEALERLAIGAETILGQLDPSQPNAEILFNILIEEAPDCRHLSKYDYINALAKFKPKSDGLRNLILDQLTKPEQSEYWGSLVAGEIFAEQFSHDMEMRRLIIEEFEQNPTGNAATALAELILREKNSEIKELLLDKTKDVDFDIASHFKLVAALSQPESILNQLRKFLNDIPLDIFNLQISRWMPAMIRRFENDHQVRSVVQETLSAKSSSSEKVSFVSMLINSSSANKSLKDFANAELQNSGSINMPKIGFDLMSQEYRIVNQVIIEVL